MIPDITALVERLRRKGRGIMPYNPDGHEAADALIRLSADAARVGVMREALKTLEAACDNLASTRSQGTYLRMIDDDDAAVALSRLDDARRDARAALAPASSEGEG